MKKILTVALVLISLKVSAQELQNFNLLDVIHNKTISLNDYSSKAGLVIIFVSNNCPFDDYYSGRIKTLGQDNVPVLLINSSGDVTESIDKMIERGNQLGLTVPYLADKDQVVMQNLNAHKSTEAYLVKNSGGKFTVYYHGPIDDNPQVAGDVKHAYLKDAIARMLNGQPAEAVDARPWGCNIKKN